MKRAIVIGLLTVLWIIGVGCFGTPQGEIAPDQFATFADWCRDRDRLTPEAQHTVATLLEEAETQECDRAQNRLLELTGLSLSTKGIVDVSPFASLTNLTSLLLNYNQITDVSPLVNLTNLTALALDYNQIEDVSALVNLTHLTDLYLRGNRITDVSALANLTNLTDLRLSENPLENRTCPVQPANICQF